MPRSCLLLKKINRRTSKKTDRRAVHPANGALAFFWSAAACRRFPPRACSRRDEARADEEREQPASQPYQSGSPPRRAALQRRLRAGLEEGQRTRCASERKVRFAVGHRCRPCRGSNFGGTPRLPMAWPPWATILGPYRGWKAGMMRLARKLERCRDHGSPFNRGQPFEPRALPSRG
jgi:hypothetical protein